MVRNETKTVKIGNIYLGGNNKILIQSMCNIKTSKVSRVVKQIHELEEAGCDLIRVSILDENDAKALKKIKSTIQPIPIKREKVYYNDNVIVDEFASATAIRKLLKNEEFSEIRKVVPKSTYQILKKETELGNVVLDLSRYEKEIIYNLRRMTVSEIAELPDVNEGLEHSLKNAANYSNDITNLINIVKTKRYTVTRIQRILICALLGITKRDVGMAKKAEPYIRVLGFNEKGKELISRINKQNPKATVITSVKKFQDKNNNNKNSKIYKRLLDIDIFSTNVYTMACKSESLANLDYTKNMVIL